MVQKVGPATVCTPKTSTPSSASSRRLRRPRSSSPTQREARPAAQAREGGGHVGARAAAELAHQRGRALLVGLRQVRHAGHDIHTESAKHTSSAPFLAICCVLCITEVMEVDTLPPSDKLGETGFDDDGFLSTRAYIDRVYPSSALPPFDDPGELTALWGRRWGADDEVGPLRVVLMRRPGREFDAMRGGVFDPACR